MASFAHLPAEDRWALAFHAGRFAYPGGSLADQGRRIWEGDAALRARIPDLAALMRAHADRACREASAPRRPRR